MVLQRLIWLQLEMPMRYLLSPWRMFWRHTSLKRPTVQTPEKYWSLHSTPLAPCLAGSCEHALHELKEIEKRTLYQCWSYFDIYLRSATLVWEPKLHCYLARGCLNKTTWKSYEVGIYVCIYGDIHRSRSSMVSNFNTPVFSAPSLPHSFAAGREGERGCSLADWLVGWMIKWFSLTCSI